MQKKTKNKGFIAIISLLIISTVSMFIAMTILKDGIENASLSLSSIYYEDARINADICLEDVLMRIKEGNEFSQNLNYAIDPQEGCNSSIDWKDPEVISPEITEIPASLRVQGTAYNFVRTFDHELKLKKFKINLANEPVKYMNVINITSTTEIKI